MMRPIVTDRYGRPVRSVPAAVVTADVLAELERRRRRVSLARDVVFYLLGVGSAVGGHWLGSVL